MGAESKRQRWTIGQVLALGGLLLLAGVLAALATAPDGLGLEALKESAPASARSFLLEVRLPRILLGVAVGMGLAASGAALQGFLRNPLADPYVLGISGGAAVGGVVAMRIAMASGWATPMAGYTLRMMGAVVGAAVAAAFIAHLVFARRLQHSHGIILAGIAINILASAIITVIEAISAPQDAQAILFWLMGSLAELPPGMMVACCALVACTGTTVLLLRVAPALNILALGEEAADGAGVDRVHLLRVVLGASAFAAGICASLAGLIGFVGLVVPHLARRVVGSDHRVLVAASALGGGLLLVICDAGARALFSVAGTELPVGAITALLGAPLLVFFLFRSTRG